MDRILTILERLSFIDICWIVSVPILSAISIKNIAVFFRERKNYFKKLAELEANKCKGPHSWIDMTIIGSKTHVCKECYYCPEHEFYIKEHFVRAEVEGEKFYKALSEYKEKRMTEIGKSYGIDIEELQNMTDEVIAINKEFTLEYLDKKLKEMKEDKE